MKAGTHTTATDPAVPAFHFIGGKGGVGKTTCAAAFALGAAGEGRDVLVASTDPAPSLGDALATPLASAPRRVRLSAPGSPEGLRYGAGRLSGVEINATLALRRWLSQRRPVLEKIAVEGTWLDHDDITRLLRLSLPGIDELAALLEIARLARKRRYDLVVVDTAPTGHTLRMLAMPETLGGIAAVFDRMRQKQRVMEEALRGSWRSAVEDALIEELAATARELSSLLRDRARTRVSWVTLAEPMAVAETRDAIAALRESGIRVDAIVANRLTPPPPSACGHCTARRALESRALRTLPRGAELITVGARDAEPRGITALSSIAAEIRRARRPPLRPPLRPSAPVRRWKATVPGRPAPPAHLVPGSARLVLFGGKGGVGKTTCAAALAVAAARRWPQRRVLLISTDPAHSLSDVFGRRVSDAPGPIPAGPGNLDVREMDAAKILKRIRERYVEAVDRMFDRLAGGGSFDAAHDRSAVSALIELAPPGLDELTAVLEITDALFPAPPEWDLVVMDTAPTGHALRLLEMPGLIQEWARALMTILLKYQAVARLGELGQILLNLSKGVGRLRDLLASPEQAMFIAVTRAAALPRLETARLIGRLAKLGIHVPVVVVNAVGRGKCGRCEKSAAAERRELAAVRRTLAAGAGLELIVAGAEIPPPSGAPALRRWGDSAWRSTPGYHQSR
ncbi:MAG TPA: ArsA family ATPase [Vicinamibacterales bacterium]|nr:ArsA family ATPase [Vicinamibacterales bacterium]